MKLFHTRINKRRVNKKQYATQLMDKIAACGNESLLFAGYIPERLMKKAVKMVPSGNTGILITSEEDKKQKSDFINRFTQKINLLTLSELNESGYMFDAIVYHNLIEDINREPVDEQIRQLIQLLAPSGRMVFRTTELQREDMNRLMHSKDDNVYFKEVLYHSTYKNNKVIDYIIYRPLIS
jgi:hypothetical protein